MSLNSNFPIITIDGPSGSGKGTVCWTLAKTLGLDLLDSGALYRIVGLQAFNSGLLTDQSSHINEDDLEAMTSSLKICFVANPKTTQIDVIVNDVSIGREIRNETVGGYASRVAVFPKVRAALLQLQRDMANNSGVIADGRDMGTIVFPHATAKIFLTASAESRAERRVKQLVDAGNVADYTQILQEIKERDYRDENRSSAPSKPAADALFIDSSFMTATEVFNKIKNHCIQCGIDFST